MEECVPERIRTILKEEPLNETINLSESDKFSIKQLNCCKSI